MRPRTWPEASITRHEAIAASWSAWVANVVLVMPEPRWPNRTVCQQKRVGNASNGSVGVNANDDTPRATSELADAHRVGQTRQAHRAGDLHDPVAGPDQAAPAQGA